MGSAAPVVITVVAVVASVYAGPEVGAAIMEGMGVTDASAATVAAVGSAAIGGSTSAVNAAVQGKNVEGILKAGAIGAVSSAAGSEVSSAIGPDGLPMGQAGPPAPVDPATKIAQSAASGATSGFTSAELSGSNLKQATKQAEIGGATGAATSAIGQGLQAAGASPETANVVSGTTSPFIRQDISNIFSPQTASTNVGGSPSGSVTTTGQSGSTGPGSQALAQALNVGDPSSPVQTTEGGGPSRNVWNQASLRTTDQVGSDTGSNV